MDVRVPNGVAQRIHGFRAHPVGQRSEEVLPAAVDFGDEVKAWFIRRSRLGRIDGENLQVFAAAFDSGFLIDEIANGGLTRRDSLGRARSANSPSAISNR